MGSLCKRVLRCGAGREITKAGSEVCWQAALRESSGQALAEMSLSAIGLKIIEASSATAASKIVCCLCLGEESGERKPSV